MTSRAATSSATQRWPDWRPGWGLDSGRSAATDISRAPARRENFDAGWKFSRGDFASANSPEFGDQGWEGVDLPHDWSILGPYNKDEPCGGSGGYLPTGISWNRKTFTLPASPGDQRVLVLFDGVYQRSEVRINGQPLGLRPYGYVSFVDEAWSWP